MPGEDGRHQCRFLAGDTYRDFYGEHSHSPGLDL
jgi:hypothetical protein